MSAAAWWRGVLRVVGCPAGRRPAFPAGPRIPPGLGGKAGFGLLLGMVLAFIVLLPVEAQPDRIRLWDLGQPRWFEVAMDELAVGSEREGFVVWSGDRARSLFKLADRGRRLSRERGGSARLVLYQAGAAKGRYSRRIVTGELDVVVEPGRDGRAMASALGFEYVGSMEFAPGHHLWRERGIGEALLWREVVRATPGVLDVHLLLARNHKAYLVPNDPLFPDEWHLQNTGQGGGVAGIDANLTEVWDRYTGRGIVIGIVDDGLEYTHPDLAAHVDTSLQKDFNDGDSDPAPVFEEPFFEDFHGTAVAGVAAAVGDNGRGVAGAAFGATLAGIRLISGPVSDADEARAMTHAQNQIHIKVNSWGPAEEGASLGGPDSLTRNALRSASENGRNGKGLIFVFAGGNGGANGANVNYNGYANSIYTIAVGAVGDDGRQASYSNPGAGLVVSAPSSSRGRQSITTVDVTGANGLNDAIFPDPLTDQDFTSRFGGTSAAAPLVGGVVALMLQANPELGWRDVQEILIRSAVRVDPEDSDWVVNAAGFHFNHKYGAGMVDAAAAVDLAETWDLLPGAVRRSYAVSSGEAIPDNDPEGLVVRFEVSDGNLRVEHVRLTATIAHAYRGDLGITLISPAGTPSRLSERHGDPNPNFDAWRFSSVRSWGEDAEGIWKLRVADLAAGLGGTAGSFQLELFGTPAASAPPQLQVGRLDPVDLSEGNGNGIPEPGETIEETLLLENNGETAGETTFTLTSPTEGIEILTPSTQLPGIGSGESLSLTNAVRYQVASEFPCGGTAEFRLTMATEGEEFVHVWERRIGREAGDVAPLTASRSDVNLAIPDEDEISDTVAVAAPAGRVIEDLDVAVRIEHPYVGDLRLELEHPDGTRVLLSSFKGGNGADYGSGYCFGGLNPTVFDHQSTRRLSGGAAPFLGAYTPDGNLARLFGKPASGTWILHILDDAAGDMGNLLCWELRLQLREPAYECEGLSRPPLAYDFERFVPMNGSLAVRLAGEDPLGAAIEYVLVTPPQSGEIVEFEAASGRLTYRPNTNFRGEDRLEYRVRNDRHDSRLAVLTFDIDFDLDRDLLADGWERRHFNSLSRPEGAAGEDPDGDGVNNRGEFLAGTNPTLAEDVMQLNGIRFDGVGVHVSFETVWGRLYHLQRTRTPAAGDWVEIGAMIAGDGETATVVDAATGGPFFFYRIALVE